MGFPGMIASVPRVTHKVTLKPTKRIFNIMRECAGHTPGNILHWTEVYWFLLRPSPQVLPLRDPLNKHSYADTKLGHWAPNT